MGLMDKYLPGRISLLQSPRYTRRCDNRREPNHMSPPGILLRLCFRLCGKLCLTLLLGGGLFLSSNAIAQTRDWQPQRTWVFVVGTLQWKHRDVFDSFPQKNRRDAQLVEFFRQQGVPAQQLVYLQDAQATTRQVKTAFAAFVPKAREGDLLFVLLLWSRLQVG